jgi:DNA repair exonuclease SbcCD nuclease subunit
MRRKPIALAVSDIHFNEWAQYNSDGTRTYQGKRILSTLANRCKKLNVPLIFTGDLLHDNDRVTNTILRDVNDSFRNLKRKGVRFIAIDGNHDQVRKNYIDSFSPNYIESLSYAFSNIDYCRFTATKVSDGILAIGIPYITNNKDYGTAVKICVDKLEEIDPRHKRKWVCLIHTSLPGAKEPSGFERTEAENMNRTFYKMFKDFDLVLSGHIHKPQRVAKGIYMLGAPAHQTKSDMGCEMGYWEVYEDLTMKFKALDEPQYIPEHEAKDYDTYNYIVPTVREPVLPEGTQEAQKFLNTDSRVKIAKKYCKARGIKSKKLRNTLDEILREVE